MIVAKFAAVLKKDAITALRYRNGFVFAWLAQVAQLATFYFLSRAVGPQFHPDGMPYFLFLLMGTGFYTFLLAGAHSFLRTIQESQQAGTLEVLLTTATPAPVLVALNAASAFAGGIVQFGFCIAIGVLFFAPMVHANLAACFLVFLFSVLISGAIGLFAAGLQIAIHKGSAVLWLVGSGAWLMSGTLFPTSALPRPIQTIANCIPFTHSLTGLRLALLSGNQPTIFREIEVLGIFAMVLVPTGAAFFSWTVREARQAGSLSFY